MDRAYYRYLLKKKFGEENRAVKMREIREKFGLFCEKVWLRKSV
jgi:hypothetical protein